MSRLSEAFEAEISTETINQKESPFGVPVVAPTADELRQQQEEQESIELARRLMEEEAMASYEQHFGMIRQDELSPEDFAALQSALREENGVSEDNGDDYDAMLELSERIGNVKSERWAMVARKTIERLESIEYEKNSTKITDEPKCLVCQCEYEVGEKLRRLPCGHCFHQDCVDEWLLEKDICPYCRESIVGESTE